MRERVALRDLELQDVFSVLVSLLVDEVCSGETTRQEARTAVNEWIEEASAGVAPAAERVPDRENWGKRPEQVKAAAAAMNIFGPPPESAQ